MSQKPISYTSFDEDNIDLEKIKKKMSTVSFIKKHNRKRILILSVARVLLFFISLGLFLFLFSLASEVISLF